MFLQDEVKNPISMQKRVQNFADVLHCMTVCSNLFFTLKRKLVFADDFSVNLSVIALPIVPKVEFNFEVILYITIFVF